MPLTITLNGQQKTLDLGQNPHLALVVTELGLQPDRVALEHNGTIIPRPKWLETYVSEGDRIELVHFVGGGAPVS